MALVHYAVLVFITGNSILAASKVHAALLGLRPSLGLGVVSSMKYFFRPFISFLSLSRYSVGTIIAVIVVVVLAVVVGVVVCCCCCSCCLLAKMRNKRNARELKDDGSTLPVVVNTSLES
jgi:hypothetical protein